MATSRHDSVPAFVCGKCPRCRYASFRPHLAAVALAFSLALHLHQVGQGTFTPKLLNMPSTQLNRLRRQVCWGPSTVVRRIAKTASLQYAYPQIAPANFLLALGRKPN